MGMSLEQIAELVDINPKAIYKWAYSKNNGGARPTYNAITLLKERGASDKSLFGLEKAVESKEDEDGFRERVKSVLRELLG
jgi:transcriptional regulator with XRE-family HTH domain